MLGDAALLERVIANLVENASKWSPPDTVVRVEAGAVHDLVHLRVASTEGRASRRPDRGRALRTVPTARRSRSRTTGVGLGLAVARGFIAAMGGDLELDDTPGGGTTAIVTLREASS